MAVKFKNLEISKILNANTNSFFSSSFQGYVHTFEVNTVLKNNSAVSRYGYLYGVKQKFSLATAFTFF